MRYLLMTPLLALVACATAPSASPTGGHCDAAPVQHFVGQAATQEAGSRIVSESHSATLRWIPMGAMVTMDFSESRVNVRLDSANRMLSISCG